MSTAVAGDLGNVESLKNYAIWKKATGASSAIAPGLVVKLTNSTGVGAVATAGTEIDGPFGVVPKLYPLNTDSDDTFNVITGEGAEMYVTADGVIKPNAEVALSASTDGQVVAFATGSPTADPKSIVGTYLGHVDEGSGLDNEATDAADGDVIRIRLK